MSFDIIHKVLILAKKYIHDSRLSSREVSFLTFLVLLKQNVVYEMEICYSKNDVAYFENTWKWLYEEIWLYVCQVISIIIYHMSYSLHSHIPQHVCSFLEVICTILKPGYIFVFWTWLSCVMYTIYPWICVLCLCLMLCCNKRFLKKNTKKYM